MFQRLALFYETHIKPHLFPSEDLSDMGSENLHHRKIRLAGRDIQNTSLPLKKRVQAASYIGLLAYTGGYAAGTCAGEFMASLIGFLKHPAIMDKGIMTVLQSLSGICYIHLHNQKRAKDLELVDILLNILHMKEATLLLNKSTQVKFWSCYLLSVLCCNNIPIIKTLNNSERLQRDLEILAHKGWYGWPNNYAKELLQLLGYARPKH
ncbi:armadillo-like helical domain-containing protein 2 [Lepisosteus oculatus]|uniref:armadillo-like helical domain-containing protein 2 n=1 Tax=Lepisosteus oculatus TaxID=7918 RepID=UPI00074025BC|nr:PREDICTED: uncharacterized protein C6orf229 homolog [Lepisosteus oculatus]